MPHTVLLVESDSNARSHAAAILSNAGYLVAAASSFDEANRRLALAEPDLLIADVRLGAYNGLHIIGRGRAAFPHIAAIVTHVVRDPVLEAEATALNAVYLVKPLDPPLLLEVVRGLLEERPTKASPTVQRRWPRKTLRKGFVATVGEIQAKVIDLSYGGLCLEMTDVEEENLRAAQQVNLPAIGLSLQGRAVWVRQVGPAGPWWCGVDLNEADAPTVDAWREFVDAAT